MNFGPGTPLYYPSYLTTPQQQGLHQRLLKFCKEDARFQIFQCTSLQMVKGGVPRLKAPKAEYYILDEQGRRPHYKWAQMNNFDHAGLPMPPILRELCDKLNTDFNLTGDDRLNHCLIICNEQTGTGPDAHSAPWHADKIQKGFFFDVSLGYARTMRLHDVQVNDNPNDNPVVASQALASGSLAYITAHDNGRLKQGVKKAKGESKVKGTRYGHSVPVDPHQPRDEPRFSLVFRPITDHPKRGKCGEHLAKVNEAKAARVRPGGDLWREYVPLCRGGSGAEPAKAAAEKPAKPAKKPAKKPATKPAAKNRNAEDAALPGSGIAKKRFGSRLAHCALGSFKRSPKDVIAKCRELLAEPLNDEQRRRVQQKLELASAAADAAEKKLKKRTAVYSALYGEDNDSDDGVPLSKRPARARPAPGPARARSDPAPARARSAPALARAPTR